MVARFNKLPFLGRIVTVMVGLFVTWILLQLVLGLIKALIPLAIVATLIVILLWIFDRVRD